MYVLPLPEIMSEQFEIEKDIRMKLDVPEKVVPSPLILFSMDARCKLLRVKNFLCEIYVHK